jgi:hypothetical protein
MIKPTWRQHPRLPPFAKNAKDGAPAALVMSIEVKSPSHAPRRFLAERDLKARARLAEARTRFVLDQ